MLEYTIVKRIAVIKEWGNTSLQLNIIKWGDSPEKYDLRRWNGEIPGRGVTLEEDDMIELFNAIGEELDLFEELEENDPIKEGERDGNELVSYGDHYIKASELRQNNEIDYRSFFIYGGDGKCRKPDHYYHEEVMARVMLLRTDMRIEEVEFPAIFCQKCNAYYISENEYAKIIARGRLLCQLMSVNEYNQYKKELDYSDLNPQSVLYMLGYTVNSKDDYSDKYRQEILSFAIDSGIVTKEEAINHISTQIRTKEGHPNCNEAIQKWHRDRDFLTGYRSGPKRIVGVTRIVL